MLHLASSDEVTVRDDGTRAMMRESNVLNKVLNFYSLISFDSMGHDTTDGRLKLSLVPSFRVVAFNEHRGR